MTSHDEEFGAAFHLGDREKLTHQARRASDLMKALSHETRMQIVCLLSDGEKSVTELERALGMAQATVSQQLARLRLDRLVTARRDGRMIYYTLSRSSIVPVIFALNGLLQGAVD